MVDFFRVFLLFASIHSIACVLCTYFIILHSIFFLIVTRMLTRVLHRAGVRELSRFAVTIKRNRRYDAVALPLRNVVVQRRMSDVPAQPPPRIRRLSLAVSRQPTSMDVDIQHMNVDQLIAAQHDANAEADQSDANTDDDQQSDIATNEVEANSVQSMSAVQSTADYETDEIDMPIKQSNDE